MEVTLIDYTGKGSENPARQAANVLVFTKQTRLKMNPDQMAIVEGMSDSEIEKELEYMANTIPSSWEFVHYSFLINGVTRGFTHQFVRTRTGSYAQQTMRVLDVGGWTYGTGPTISEDFEIDHDTGRNKAGVLASTYDETMYEIREAYDKLIAHGAAIEDARGILPTNIHTNICADFNLRVITDLVRKRSSSRTQGEYRDVLEAMKAEVIKVHPWAELFINRNFDVAAIELENRVRNLCEKTNVCEEHKIEMIKLIDQMRKG